ncbi:hypothetical protein ASZ90_017261 [hydrocarbon metagenome]|uniref:Uncharacterized protein n=1 Tax=hydrocarbon metagenome TaxID=938273 RepID=A0A0W8E9R5_9ZZZZ
MYPLSQEMTVLPMRSYGGGIFIHAIIHHRLFQGELINFIEPIKPN